MKKVTIIITGVILMTIASLDVSAQADSSTDDAIGTASIITPISLTNTQGLAFGNIAAGNTSGTIYISTNGGRTATGGVTASSTGAFNNALYTANGQPNTMYSITLPSFSIVSNGTNNMYLNGFTSFPIVMGMFDAAGMQTISVGATLNVNANQPTGNYSGVYNVTISYE